MKKLTINEAAKKLGITKEAIYNRIRRGSIETMVENGEKNAPAPGRALRY